MPKIKICTFMAALTMLLVLLGCETNYKYEIDRSANGIVIHQDSILITITVVDESIIHIHKILNDQEASSIPDYVTVLEPQPVAWELIESDEQVTIITDKLKVNVENDGMVNYESIDSKPLLAETNENTFLKNTGQSANSVSQEFTSGDEGLFGLGHYQNGIMNWKNVPVRMQQYNQEIAIPFIVSTNKFGIYWNNYSVTDFNPPDYEIELETIIDEEKNIRKTEFVPKKTGSYSFIIESDSFERRDGKIFLTIDTDTIINYTTTWVPVAFSGQKYLEEGKTYPVVFQNSGSRITGKLLYNEPDYNKTIFSSRSGNAINYYFIHGDNPSTIISKYRKLTGQAPLFPKSAYGFWQCRERYQNQNEILEKAQEYRKRKIPVDNIVQDWYYWPKGTKGPEWDREKYPDPQGMTKTLADLNLKLMVSVWPEVDNTPLLEKYDLFEYKFKTEGNHYLDFYEPKVGRQFYEMLSDSMFKLGVNHIWLDGTEPIRKPHDDEETGVGPFRNVANIYSLLVAEAMYNGRRDEFPEERVFNLTRSAFPGQQRYGSASWSGDVAGTWKQFSEQITGGMNFVMAGVPYWTNDIGGFFRDSKSLNPIYDDQYENPEYIELLTRWFQFGTFNPIFRIHGYRSDTEVWNYGKEFENMARKFIDVRYQLMPYIYSEAWNVTKEGKLLMAPMVYEYPQDKNTWQNKDQFLFGESLLVCNVTNYKQRTKEIYLPKGGWYNFWTGEKIMKSGTVEVNTPLNEIPLFVKAGSILPMGPKIQYATQKTDEPVQIKIYPGKDAQYQLYLDDGESYRYEKGIYSEVLFSYYENNKQLSISTKVDEYVDFKKNPMNLKVEIIGGDNIEEVVFNGDKIEVKL
ncbi:hypothetical protein BFP77_05865 [Maribacter sp. 4U21]|uniref:glycoside hydrolase family 31 protein n=1 Tax=Maribacter sp. 4U21 TaxID=1889779 RepID=UPI000C155B7D|nr:TIM-barrel domain-containing protein [Maribacter sp. 4U21]PIB29508.1 hypothetical protein BFP77_05865 [Maribacter sp. 4U21]